MALFYKNGQGGGFSKTLLKYFGKTYCNMLMICQNRINQTGGKGKDTVAKYMKKLGYHYVDTIYDDDFIYDVYENALGQQKLIIVDAR